MNRIAFTKFPYFQIEAKYLLIFLAQTPAPVQQTRITQSGTHWASVSWNLPTATTSSYVTQLQISVYVNDRYLWRRTISRRTQYNITGLNPNTVYTFKIKTRDVLQWNNELFHETFKTKEAGIH